MAASSEQTPLLSPFAAPTFLVGSAVLPAHSALPAVQSTVQITCLAWAALSAGELSQAVCERCVIVIAHW